MNSGDAGALQGAAQDVLRLPGRVAHRAVRVGEEPSTGVRHQRVLVERHEFLRDADDALLAGAACVDHAGAPVATWERRHDAACAPLPGYRRHQPEKTLLHAVVRGRLEPFLAAARERSPSGRPASRVGIELAEPHPERCLPRLAQLLRRRPVSEGPLALLSAGNSLCFASSRRVA